MGFGLALLIRPRAWLLLLGEALALGLLVRLWFLTAGGPLAQALYEPLAGIQLAFRVDHLGLFFALSGLGLGVLQALPSIGWPLAPVARSLGWLLLAQFGMVTAVLAGELETMAAGWSISVAAIILTVLLQRRLEPPLAMDGPASRYVAVQASAAVLLLSGAVAAEAAAGTGAFDSIPVSAFNVRVYTLLAAAPVVAMLTVDLLCRAVRRLPLAALAASTVLLPMSAYVLFRLYDLGGGRLPDGRLGGVMVILGGVTALAFSLSSLWAVDLGAAAVRIAQAACGLVVTAAGAGTGLGLFVLALAPISLGLGLAALLALVEAGYGRLPRVPSGGWRPPVVAACLLTLGWAGGLLVGPELFLRLATLRSGLGASAVGAAAMAPAVLAVPLMAYAAYSCARFAGDTSPTGLPRARLALFGIALAATGAAPLLLAPTLTVLAAAALRLSAAEVQSSLGTVVPGLTPTAVASAVVTAAALGFGLRPSRQVSITLPAVRQSLPPRVAVAPGIYGIRLATLWRRRVVATVALARSHRVITGLVLWTAAVAAAASILR